MIYIGNIEILTAKSAIYLGNVGQHCFEATGREKRGLNGPERLAFQGSTALKTLLTPIAGTVCRQAGRIAMLDEYVGLLNVRQRIPKKRSGP